MGNDKGIKNGTKTNIQREKYHFLKELEMMP